MKSYLLLRDNQQSGPYFIQELKQKGVYPLDLVWIEGNSTAWQYPNEIPELQNCIKAKKADTKKKRSTTSSSTTLANNYQQVTQTTAVSSPMTMNAPTVNTNGDYYSYEGDSKDLYAEIKYLKPGRRLSFNGNVMGLFLIVIGTAMAAFIVKNIVGTFGNEPGAPASQAREITSENLTSENNSAAFKPAIVQASMINAPVKAIPLTPAPEPVPVEQKVISESSNSADVKQPTDGDLYAQAKSAIEQPIEIKKVDNALAATANTKADAVTKTEERQDLPKEKKAVKDIRSMVHLSANDYKVGVLGGITNMELQVSNNSPTQVDKATVEVNYMKPNGAVVKTETLQVRDIQPGKSKTIQVPSSSRGVKVGYRVVEAS